ncbi:unnamed protein product [Arctia plantaginis]|uniref:Globin domain-containing protein n=1 Tax=Arctia plantaginis TaxID=874455 RepID=A0A8S0YVF5_ARCPL|nr:unnamed protein product [Arctia plantaginis]
MAKKSIAAASAMKPIVFTVDPTECPFREFKDNELQPEYWGMGPAAFKGYSSLGIKGAGPPKLPADYVWVDDQTQALPRSVRQYLNGWVRAEQLAMDRWEAEVVVFEEDSANKMVVADIQLSHAQVLLRSAFCRNVLSACFMLERCETVMMEHQWENFTFALGPEGWRAKNHIYSPGIKPGGGAQHRPGLSRNGCYLVRLFYLGAWRCVWVSDQVPVDATDSPLLPFSPLLSKVPPGKPGAKQAPTTVTSDVVHLWPLLLCKALLKLAAPDMNADENSSSLEDELLPEFDVLHALTGAMNMKYLNFDASMLWDLIISEVNVFSWDDDDETQASTVKSRSTKKPTTKETSAVKRGSMMSIILEDTKDYPPYYLQGITPGFKMSLLVTMARDIPLKKPLPEPEVALWKYYRWVDWARSHGMYEAYDCPRTKFLKVNSLMKMSYAPHLLDVQSTESITATFIKLEMEKTTPGAKAKGKDAKPIGTATPQQPNQTKEELREWIPYEIVQGLILAANVLYYPSMYEFTSAANSPPVRITKIPMNRALDIQAPKGAPLYLQIDGPEENVLKISLSMLHPRILCNSGVLIVDFIESAYLVLERFEWFKDSVLPLPKAFVRTCGYDAVEVKFPPGRHYCRIWVHSRMNWHIMLLSESALLLGLKDQIQCAAVRECPWASKFLLALGSAFVNWLRVNRSNQFLPGVQLADREFFRSYYPDLPWDKEVVGYDRALLHWMFRQALQVHLLKRLHPTEASNVYAVVRKYFCDPDFGFPPKPPPPFSLKVIAETDPCDCLLPEIEETELDEEQTCYNIEEESHAPEEKIIVEKHIMDKLLLPPKPPIASNICELATEEVPCGIMKEERDKVIKKHMAATVIQAHWRGTWARKCLIDHVTVSPEVMKLLQDTTFGNQEALAGLMREFFILYPGAKYAYSVASALSGFHGLHQHHGTTLVTSKCKWIPYFQGVFYCHDSVKVHFDVTSTLHHSTLAVYNNDTGEKLPQAYNAHKTFEFSPNMHGYTVMGHGTLNEVAGFNYEVQWQLTVFSSTNDDFHICDNEDPCTELPLSPAHKLHIDEIFIPNRRNILGGIQLSVTRHEAVSFRTAATSPDLEIIATLRTISADGESQELTSCSGKGEIYWPYIRLEPFPDISRSTVASKQGFKFESARSLIKSHKSKGAGTKNNRSALKIKESAEARAKQYIIEVVTPYGWPLTIAQWRRVTEVRNSQEMLKLDNSVKKANVKEKVVVIKTSAKDKQMPPPPPNINQPQPGDAYVELECSSALGGGIIAKRDDEREMEFANAVRAWDENEVGRNKRGAEIRKLFREEHMETPPPPPSESTPSTQFDLMHEGTEAEELDELKKEQEEQIHGPTPVTESDEVEMSLESEEELEYLTMPEQLRDKFLPLDFLPLCIKELAEHDCVLVTPMKAEAAKQARQARIEAALHRMCELQEYNEVHVLGRQKERCQLLDNLSVDATWPPQLQLILEERDEAIVQENLLMTLAAAKKKQEQTKEKPKK